MDAASNNGGMPPPSGLPQQVSMFQKRYQTFLDTLTPYYYYRWGFTAFAALVYCIRVFFAQGWYIVTYALGIYLLNLFLAFLTPKFDPALEDLDSDNDGPSLPTRTNDEFRPFIRRLPEFKFWYGATRGILIGFFCTLFKFFDVPVFWPILLMYFCILFAITMKRQLKHMIKYKYVPWNLGKKKYGKGNAL
ncbi:retrieval of early ER protein Rer1 [Gaertneriomyces semiglobifer]|nr:retrieval of early ER protein Rer1 [Gaertneriomyces semiglobifer]